MFSVMFSHLFSSQYDVGSIYGIVYLSLSFLFLGGTENGKWRAESGYQSTLEDKSRNSRTKNPPANEKKLELP